MVKEIRLENHLLNDQFDDQVNMVHADLDGMEYNFVMDKTTGLSALDTRPIETADVVILGGEQPDFLLLPISGKWQLAFASLILEQGREVLQKVKISGGGRCNVTHACWDPADLVKYYPRGEKNCWVLFTNLPVAIPVAWFEERGVPLKVEADGRMFPVSDDSASIVDWSKNAKKAGPKFTSHKVNTVNNPGWI